MARDVRSLSLLLLTLSPDHLQAKLLNLRLKLHKRKLDTRVPRPSWAKLGRN